MTAPPGHETIPNHLWNVKTALNASPAATTAVPSFMLALEGGTLPVRQRELAILRVAAVVGSDYEWGRHVHLARSRAQVDDDTLRAVRVGDVTGLSEVDALVVRAAEAVQRRVVDTALREELAEHFDAAQVTELILVTSFYVGLACAIDGFGIELDADITWGLSYP